MAERRLRVAAAAVLGAATLAAAGCGGSGGKQAASTAAATTTAAAARLATAASFQAFRGCLSAHGVSLPRRGARPPTAAGTPAPRARGRGRSGLFLLQRLTPAQRGAFQACRSKLPGGGRFRGSGRRRPGRPASPAFAKYTACLARHGVRFGAAGQSRAAFRKAQAACRPLLPAAG